MFGLGFHSTFRGLPTCEISRYFSRKPDDIRSFHGKFMTQREASSDTVEMVLETDFSSVERVVDDTSAFLEDRIEDEDLAYRIVLLATEAVTNAIEHGNKMDPSKQVFFRMDVLESRIEIVVEDQGSGFDPTKTDDPTESEHLFREGGRGLLFMEEMADDVQFEKDGRLVRLIFHVR